MTIAVDLGRKSTKQTKQTNNLMYDVCFSHLLNIFADIID